MMPGNLNLARLIPQIDLSTCNGCGNCAALCPAQVVIVLGDKAVIAQPDQCTYCDVCETYCPVGAIGRPFVVVFAQDQIASATDKRQQVDDVSSS